MASGCGDVATTNNPKRVMSDEQTAAMLEKERIVLDARRRGKSFYWIEKTHGIANADRVWKRAIARTENIEYLRTESIRLEEQRLDDLQDGIWDKAISGDVRAVEGALKILERRARMLGLDFQDMISGQLVEIEQAKVRLIATALARALATLELPSEARQRVTTVFLEDLRQHQILHLPEELEAG
jgi:hypothetical protein